MRNNREVPMPVLNRNILVRLFISIAVAFLAIISLNILLPYLASDGEYVPLKISSLFIGFFVFWVLSAMVILVPHILNTRKSHIHPLQSVLFVIPAILLALYIVSKLI